MWCRCSEVQAEAAAAHAAAQQADAHRAAAQAQLDQGQARIAAMREELGARRARVDELQTTYAAKREMVVEAQLQWSKRSASCSTQVAVKPACSKSQKGQAGSQPGEEAAGLGGSLRRAIGEVCYAASPVVDQTLDCKPIEASARLFFCT